MNISVEDYMRTIYALSEEQAVKTEGIRSISIAEEMHVSKSGVSQMLNKLNSLGYINREAYGMVSFTGKGLKEAKRIMHNHRVIEVFLRQVLKYKVEDVHDEAHRLEHAFSEESIRRLDKFLKNPTKSPSGKTIPHD
jgi:DtxR family Mn-dependent transcriptional regulator